jgi:thymidylate synthase ThyX
MDETKRISTLSAVKKSICARVVADSINEQGNRVTTFIVLCPRIVLAEFNTHRVLSRNSASSRARPFQVVLQEVVEDPFIPIRWLTAHKGMQGTEEIADPKIAIQKWLLASKCAVTSAKLLDEENVTKQFVNRLLEPFMWHEVIITATAFENFFALRAHPDAEIHIARLAECMLEAYNASTPRTLHAGEWHVPFSDQIDDERVAKLVTATKSMDEIKRMIAVARCARISYKPFGSEDEYNYAADLKLFASLVANNHMSPLEHLGRAMTMEERSQLNARSGNFEGFIQYRKMFQDENRTEPRVLKKRPRTEQNVLEA